LLTKRIIACLDVTGGRVVKGVKFKNLRDAGDPAECADAHARDGADEIVLLDITATSDHRETMLEAVSRAARSLFVPLAVGGGIRKIADAAAVFDAGADKIAINSAAVRQPELITEIAMRFGSQAVVVAIDAKRRNSGFEVFVNGGRVPTGRDVIQWARESEARGAGEILLTSMDRDGTRQGFDIPLTQGVADSVSVPVIASGGVGNLDHLVDGIRQGHATAVLAASIFHFGEFTIREAKDHMVRAGLPMRLDP